MGVGEGQSRFIYLVFYVMPSILLVILRWVIGRADKTSTYSWSKFYTVNCLPTASTYQLSHIRSGQDLNSDLRGGRPVRHHCITMSGQVE